ncbi:hypothetical protein ACERNI_17745 [Camelimonas sp. ID_303_24]
MKIFHSDVPREFLGFFSPDFGSNDFFSYAGNSVTIEQAISILGVLSPDFIERDGHIFWCSNAQDYVSERNHLVALTRTASGELERSLVRADVERYANNFSVSQLFSKWSDAPSALVVKIDLSELEYKLCSFFANQLAKAWKEKLMLNFPDRKFKFEIGDDILDEYGVCVTFWQE